MHRTRLASLTPAILSLLGGALFACVYVERRTSRWDGETSVGADGDETSDSDGETCAIPSADPIAWWQAEQNTRDASGMHDGDAPNNLDYGTGKVGSSFLFDGEDDAVLVYPTGLYPKKSFTVEAWVSPVGGGAILTIYECGSGCIGNVSNSTYSLMILDGRVQGHVRDSDGGGPHGGGQTIFGNTEIRNGEFHHVGFVRDVEHGTLDLYVDGRLDASLDLDPGAAGSLADDDGNVDPLTIGAGYSKDALGDFFAGSIDELSIYFDALPSSDMRAIYEAGAHGKCTDTS